MHYLKLNQCATLALGILGIAAPETAPAQAAQDCTSYPKAAAYDLKLANPGEVPGQVFRTDIAIVQDGKPYKTHSVVIDTGSIGIVVSEQAVPPQLLKTGKQSPYFYTSSMDYFVGTEINASVRLPLNASGNAKTSVDTSPVGIRAVRCTCGIDTSKAPTTTTPSASAACNEYDGSPVVGGKADWSLKSCGNAPPSVGMMGVGFDRGGQSRANNPFLNLQTQPGRSGYVITPKGIQLGVTAANANGFKTVQLTPDTKTGWQEPQVCVTLTPPAAISEPAKTMCGDMLVDTGIDFMFLTVPPDERPSNAGEQTAQKFDGAIRTIVPPGWAMAVAAVDKNNDTILDYSIAPAAPLPEPPKHTVTSIPIQQNLPPTETVAVWANPSGANAINTGRRLIYYAGYLFDNACGQIGFQAAANPPK